MNWSPKPQLLGATHLLSTCRIAPHIFTCTRQTGRQHQYILSWLAPKPEALQSKGNRVMTGFSPCIAPQKRLLWFLACKQDAAPQRSDSLPPGQKIKQGCLPCSQELQAVSKVPAQPCPCVCSVLSNVRATQGRCVSCKAKMTGSPRLKAVLT